MNSIKKIITLVFVLGICFTAESQILINDGLQAGDLWCFPVHQKKDTYRYLPLRARLAFKNDSIPQFSYLRYIVEKPSDETTKSITEAGGGAILNFRVLYDTPSQEIAAAQTALREKMENDSIKLEGPIIFDEGKYTLVSSILNPTGSGKTQEILASGTAPIIENSEIPLTFNLDPLRSKLLLESLKMDSPDVSLLFELSFSGLTDSYEAELEVDWSEVKKSQTFEAGAEVYFVGANVELGFDELRKNQAIKFTSTGSDENIEGLVETVYAKLLKLMFEPVAIEKIPEEQRGGLTDAIGALIGGGSGGQNLSGFGANVGYQYKEHNSTGKSRMVFNGRNNVSRNHYITFNAGNLFEKYGEDKNIFRDVPLWDPAFQQRDVYVGIDGNIEKEFDKMLNSVTVKLRKKHGNGDETFKEIVITKDTYQASNGKLRMSYLNHEDTDSNEWLGYEYKTLWKFIGGGSYEKDWQNESAAMINLYVPFKRRKIELSGDLGSLAENDVRAISVIIDYDFFGESKSKNTTLYPANNTSAEPFEITLPKDSNEVNYTITWFLNDNDPKAFSGVDKYGLIFIDGLPKS